MNNDSKRFRQPGHFDPTMREEMLRVAAEIFAKREFHRTPTSEIADASKYSEGTFFNHFGSKDGILLAIFHELWGALLRRSQEISSTDVSVRQKVHAIINEVITVYLELPHHWRVTVATCYPSPDSITSKEKAIRFSDEADHFTLFRRLVLRLIYTLVRDRGIPKPKVRAEMKFHRLFGTLKQILNQHYLQERTSASKSVRISIDDIRQEMHDMVEEMFPEQ